MAKTQQLSLWERTPEQSALPDAQFSAEQPLGTSDEVAPASESTPNLSNAGALQMLETPSIDTGPPIPTPLPSAVAAGVFGFETTGPIEPDAEQVAALVHEHANELIGLLEDSGALRNAIRTGTAPETGRSYRDADAVAKAADRHAAELQRIETSYSDALAAFEEGFGPEATRRLDEWVRAEVAGVAHGRSGYEPGHPWHYYPAGDNAPPVPFEQIPPCEEAGQWLERDLPRNSAKRLQKMRELLERERLQLADDRRRYEDIVARGAAALSRFDREIAYGGNDDLARASALALKYNHIRLGLGRIRWLESRVNRNTSGMSDSQPGREIV